MKLKALLLASAVAFAAPVAVQAQEVETSFNVALTSDYVWRGVSQSDESPAIQLGADVGYGIFYLGTWASNVDFGGEAELEWDVYAGVKPTLGPVTFDFGILGYLYPQEDELNIWEGKAAASISSEGGATGTLSLFYSPEVGDDGPASWYTELAGSVPIPGATLGPFSFTAGASVGNYNFEDIDDYTNWKVGVTAGTESGWAVELAYTDTDVDEVPAFDGRAILTLKKVF
jgi:uncharacterized protein (TIGR02001 family)